GARAQTQSQPLPTPCMRVREGKRKYRDSTFQVRFSSLANSPVMRGQKRVEDARKRAYDPRIHLLRKKSVRRRMDCTGTRACPSSAFSSAASRASPTCGVKPGNDDLDAAPICLREDDVIVPAAPAAPGRGPGRPCSSR